MVLTAYGALSPAIGFFVTVIGEKHFADLISASRNQDHAILPSTFGALVLRAARVHRIPHPTFMTIRETPLVSAKSARMSERAAG